MRRKMAIDKIELVDRAALLRKSWQKSLKSSFMRRGRSEITERESERDGEREREKGRVSLHSRCMMLLNRAK